MADLPNRSEHEARLAREIAAILAQYRSEWETGLDAPQTERSLREKLLGFLLLIFTLGAGTAAGELGIALVADGAARSWANSYGTMLARGVVDAVRRRVQKAQAKDLTGATTLVRDTVDKLVTGNTWTNFAATEITRANTAGGEFSAMVYNIGRVQPTNAPGEGPLVGTPQFDGPAVTPLELPTLPPAEPPNIPEPALAIWHTSQDDRVCPICRPLHGRPRDEWQSVFPLGPPAHPVCRCFIDYQLEAREHVSEAEGVWRTIRGAKVFIQNGRITKGPRALIDKTPDEAESDEKPKRKRKAAASKPDKVNGDSSKPEPKDVGGESSEKKDTSQPKKTNDTYFAETPYTNTDEFKAFFGDSVVTKTKSVEVAPYKWDSVKVPAKVYHGTFADFQQFGDMPSTRTHATAGLGSWFSDSTDYASRVAIDKQKAAGGAASILPVYLSISNPKRYDFFHQLEDDLSAAGGADALRKRLVASGHDGIRIATATTDFPDIASTHWVAFEPNQIKSATGNRGTFSRKSNRIDEQHHGA